MRTLEFYYELPQELIAQEPLRERSHSRMLVLQCPTGIIEHRHVTDLPEYLQAGDLLVLNDTRVIPARLLGRRKDTGGRVELLLIEEISPHEWEALWKASGRPRAGLGIVFGEGEGEGEVLAVERDGRVRVFFGVERMLDLLEKVGQPPLPPYIRRRGADPTIATLDRERYQTVYARVPGAVAAPTAGLHLTKELLGALEQHEVGIAFVTLHVGRGTFRPVKCEHVEEHRMDPERFWVNGECAEAINRTRANGGRVVAVGTTTVRALETVADDKGRVCQCAGRTELFIRPPYQFRVVDALLTNFHLPESTLLMMVCAFAQSILESVGVDGASGYILAGRDLVMRAYQEAIVKRYRFYSYGDCMLLLGRRGESRVPA